MKPTFRTRAFTSRAHPCYNMKHERLVKTVNVANACRQSTSCKASKRVMRLRNRLVQLCSVHCQQQSSWHWTRRSEEGSLAFNRPWVLINESTNDKMNGPENPCIHFQRSRFADNLLRLYSVQIQNPQKTISIEVFTTSWMPHLQRCNTIHTPVQGLYTIRD